MACLHGKTQGVINPAALWAANTTIIFFFPATEVTPVDIWIYLCCAFQRGCEKRAQNPSPPVTGCASPLSHLHPASSWKKGSDSHPRSVPAHAGGALASADRPWVTATRPLPATFHSLALLFLGPVITRWAVNHRCLTLRQEETRQIVLTCLAGGILVLQCFMGFGPSCSPEWCAHPSSCGTVMQDLSDGQTNLDLCCFQPGVLFWAGTDASKAWRGFPRGPKGFYWFVNPVHIGRV